MTLQELNTIKLGFLQELEKSNIGEKTSLPFIVHELPSSSLVKEGETFQVLVIGGTVCRRAMVRKTNNGTVEIIKKEKKPQPFFTSKEVFLSFIEKETDKNIAVLAINFAFPLKPVFQDKKLDGILAYGTKEHTFEGMINQRVGVLIEKHLRKARNQTLKVSLANDTICLLLSGLTEYPWDNLACGILGTGLNFAIFLNQHAAVNLEAANFDKFPQSKEGKEIDASSARPHTALLEKETSGAYLYRHFNHLVKKKGISHPPLESTHELKKLALQNNQTDASKLARELIDHSAKLIASAVAGIAQFQKRDLTFIMDGSFFWEGRIYINLVEKYLRQLVPKRKINFASVKDSTILGAAKLVG